MKIFSFFSIALTGILCFASSLKAEAPVVVPNAPNMQPMSQDAAQTHCEQEVPKFCVDPKNAARCTDQKGLVDQCITAMTDHNMLQQERRENDWQHPTVQ